MLLKKTWDLPTSYKKIDIEVVQTTFILLIFPIQISTFEFFQ